MNKSLLMAIVAITLSACSMNPKSAVKQSDLQHHRFVLVSVDGTPVSASQGRVPEIQFGQDMHVSGKMCNGFFGKGELQNNVLTVKGMGATRMLCADQHLNQWDQVIGQVLNKGASVSLNHNTLVLSEGQHTLVYTLKDLMN